MKSSNLKKALDAWEFMQSTGAYKGLVRLQEYAAQELQRIQEGYASAITRARLEDSQCYTTPERLVVPVRKKGDFFTGELCRMYSSFEVIFVSIPLSGVEGTLPSADKAIAIADLSGLIFGYGVDYLEGSGYAIQIKGRVYLLNNNSQDKALEEALELAKSRLGCIFLQIKSTSFGKVICPKGWEP